jgi:hypothetical protein
VRFTSSVSSLPRALTRTCRAAIVYFVLMTYIVLAVLREARPLAYFALAFVLFVLSQLDFFLLNKVICKVCLRCASARSMRVLMRMRTGREP